MATSALGGGSSFTGYDNTCDIYHYPNAPPSTPDGEGVSCHLRPDFGKGAEANDGGSAAMQWTHILLVPLGTDVRDAFANGAVGTALDTLYIPDKNGTPFKVIFVERLINNKRIYLQRQQPSWPTNDL